VLIMFAGWTKEDGYTFTWDATIIAEASAATDNRVTVRRDRDGGLFFLRRVRVAHGATLGAKGTLVEKAKGRTSRITFKTVER
jgi:hypothetical protein